MSFSSAELASESQRLSLKLKQVGWNEADCELIAPLTLELNQLKQNQNALILAHSYQTPDIMYGIADVIGDSYGLSKIAAEHPAQIIIFCGVYFMAETAKLLSPQKRVFVSNNAGCSLAEAITAADVLKLKKDYPGVPVVCYVNTTAAVKAESDICCTSANAIRIINSLPDQKVIFIPDEYMGKNLQSETAKELILWPGRCTVHEQFSPEAIAEIRQSYPEVKILAHPECAPEVISKVDFAGGTEKMLNYIKNSPSEQFMLITECGLTDRVNSEFKDKKIVGSCNLCPYMKQINLRDVLQILKDPRPEQEVIISAEIAERARRTLTRMFEVK